MPFKAVLVTETFARLSPAIGVMVPSAVAVGESLSEFKTRTQLVDDEMVLDPAPGFRKGFVADMSGGFELYPSLGIYLIRNIRILLSPALLL